MPVTWDCTLLEICDKMQFFIEKIRGLSTRPVHEICFFFFLRFAHYTELHITQACTVVNLIISEHGGRNGPRRSSLYSYAKRFFGKVVTSVERILYLF